jgi:hypothetical protein
MLNVIFYHFTVNPKVPLAVAPTAAPAPPHPPGVPMVQVSLPGLLEGWQNLLEALRAQAGERLEHAAVAENLGVADH